MTIAKLTPNFEVASVRQTIEFYEQKLGFALKMAVPETQDGVHLVLEPGVDYVHAMMSKDGVEFMFQRSDSFREDITLAKGDAVQASVAFYMEVEGVESFYNELKQHSLTMTELTTKWYGMKEFYVQDVNGYILGFAEKV